MTLRVLVVDDDPAMRLICRRFFEKRGIAVREAASGEDAIDLLRGEAFDCVLSDYRMGAVTGIDVLEFAAAHRGDAVRVLLTGYPSPSIVEEARTRACVREFIEKPWNITDLEATLYEVVVERYFENTGQE